MHIRVKIALAHNQGPAYELARKIALTADNKLSDAPFLAQEEASRIRSLADLLAQWVNWDGYALLKNESKDKIDTLIVECLKGKNQIEINKDKYTYITAIEKINKTIEAENPTSNPEYRFSV